MVEHEESTRQKVTTTKTLKSCHSQAGSALEIVGTLAPLASDCRSREIGDPRVSRFLVSALPSFAPATVSSRSTLPPTTTSKLPSSKFDSERDIRIQLPFDPICFAGASCYYCVASNSQSASSNTSSNHIRPNSRTPEPSSKPTDRPATDQPIDSIDRHTNHTSPSYLLSTRDTLRERRKYHRDLLQDCRRSFWKSTLSSAIFQPTPRRQGLGHTALRVLPACHSLLVCHFPVHKLVSVASSTASKEASPSPRLLADLFDRFSTPTRPLISTHDIRF